MASLTDVSLLVYILLFNILIAPMLHHESGIKKSLLQLVGMLLGTATIFALQGFLH